MNGPSHVAEGFIGGVRHVYCVFGDCSKVVVGGGGLLLLGRLA